MSFRIYNKENLIVIVNTSDWKTTKRAEGEVWYSYNSTEAPILYNVYEKNPEQDLALRQTYQDFQKENGDSFEDDLELQAYLDEVFSVNLTLKESNGSESFADKNGASHLKVVDIDSDGLLKGIYNELRIMNFHLSTITENDIKEI